MTTLRCPMRLRMVALLSTTTLILALVRSGWSFLSPFRSRSDGSLMIPSSRTLAPYRQRRTKTSSTIRTRLQNLPRVIVFDLDNTLWSPELYQLRRLQRQRTPIAGKDVKMFEGAIKVLDEIIPTLVHHETGEPPMLAIASRTQSVAWAENLIDQFELRHRFRAIEIFPAHKTRHFAKIQQQTRVPFHEMMFFDDARDGKYGNCIPVASMGVFCVHCPRGIVTDHIFHRALDHYRTWDKTPNCIVEHDGQLTTNAERYCQQEERQQSRKISRDHSAEKVHKGVVKMIRPDKRYGFIRYRDSENNKNSDEVFFHFNNVAQINDVDPFSIEEGDEVTFQVQRDLDKNKYMAVNVSPERPTSSKSSVQLRCFSMNQPFAALLANGYKTLETRNGTMFTQYAEGTQLLLHVGQRTYPDKGKHVEIMRESGLSQDQIDKLKSLPSGFSRGMIVAVLEIGRTYETNTEERSDPVFEQNAVARGEDSGRFVTEIKSVAYLKKPIKQGGAGGVFKVRVPPEVLPDGEWYIPSAPSDEQNSGLYASIGA